MDEKKLVSQILMGNQKAISKFYKTYQTRLLNFILRKVENRKDAEEILQDTFVSSLDSLPMFKFRSSLFTWLCSISRHEIADFYRRRKIKTILFSHFPFLEKIVDKALGPQLALEEKQAKEKIFRTLKNMTEGYAKILRLKYIEGLSMLEIAQKLGLTVKAVESRLSRARKAFQLEYATEKNWQIFNSSNNQRKLSF